MIKNELYWSMWRQNLDVVGIPTVSNTTKVNWIDPSTVFTLLSFLTGRGLRHFARHAGVSEVCSCPGRTITAILHASWSLAILGHLLAARRIALIARPRRKWSCVLRACWSLTILGHLLDARTTKTINLGGCWSIGRSDSCHHGWICFFAISFRDCWSFSFTTQI